MQAKGKIYRIDCNIITITEHKIKWEGYNFHTEKKEVLYEWVINGHADFNIPPDIDFQSEYHDFEGIAQMPVVETALEIEPQYIKARVGLLGVQYSDEGKAVSCDFIVSGRPKKIENYPDLPANICPMFSNEMRKRETMWGPRYVDM